MKTTTTSAQLADGTEVELHYARITRPGLATPWSVTVHRPGGFEGPITVRSSSAYFDLFDENGLDSRRNIRYAGRRDGDLGVRPATR